MPQRHAKPLLFNPADVPALNRLSVHGGDREWNVMNWFVLLAKKDLARLSNGDFLNLQEEALAIRRTYCRDLGARANPPAMDELSRLQSDIRKSLNDLVACHQVTLGPFPVKIEINLPSAKAEEDTEISRFVRAGHKVDVIWKNLSKPENDLAKIRVWHLVSPAQTLQYEFARRLETYANAIERCPHCKTLFLQLRSTAVYCDRKCQRIAIMRNLRADAKAKAQVKKTVRRGRTASAKGGKRHGKK